MSANENKFRGTLKNNIRKNQLFYLNLKKKKIILKVEKQIVY